MENPSGLQNKRQTEEAILKTVLYSDLFDYPLTPAEIAHYLIGLPADPGEIPARLASPVWLNGQIARVQNYITVRGREYLVGRRQERMQASAGLWRKARRFAHALSCLPFVRMVAVTGALAMNNSGGGDDVDVLIVTSPGRVWLTRGLCILVVYAGKIFGCALCPNYMLSESVLSLQRQSLYIAHELVQMIPIFGFAVYRKMRLLNPWVHGLLPNAVQPCHSEPEHRLGWLTEKFKRLAEWLLKGSIGDCLERWEMERKLRRFLPLARQSGGGSILNRDQVKGHFTDHGAAITSAFDRRLQEFQLL